MGGGAGGEGVLLTRSTLGSPVRRRPTTTRRRLSGGPESACRAQASRRASTRKPLHAGSRPRADRFVTLLPNRRGLADQSQSEDRPLRLIGRSVLRPFGSSAPRHFPWPGPRRLASDPVSAWCGFPSVSSSATSGSSVVPEARESRKRGCR